jgi:hypothetical protein
MPSPVWLIESRGNHPAQVPQRLMYAVQELGMEVIPARYVPCRRGGGLTDQGQTAPGQDQDTPGSPYTPEVAPTPGKVSLCVRLSFWLRSSSC